MLVKVCLLILVGEWSSLTETMHLWVLNGHYFESIGWGVRWSATSAQDRRSLPVSAKIMPVKICLPFCVGKWSSLTETMHVWGLDGHFFESVGWGVTWSSTSAQVRRSLLVSGKIMPVEVCPPILVGEWSPLTETVHLWALNGHYFGSISWWVRCHAAFFQVRRSLLVSAKIMPVEVC